MRRRYKTKMHCQLIYGGRWGEPLTRALCSAHTSDRTDDPAQVTCEICLRYLARLEPQQSFPRQALHAD